jgi:hypothetical protein
MEPITLGFVAAVGSLAGAGLCFSYGMDSSIGYKKPKIAARCFVACALLIGLGVGAIPFHQRPSRAITATAQFLSAPVFR